MSFFDTTMEQPSLFKPNRRVCPSNYGHYFLGYRMLVMYIYLFTTGAEDYREIKLRKLLLALKNL